MLTQWLLPGGVDVQYDTCGQPAAQRIGVGLADIEARDGRCAPAVPKDSGVARDNEPHDDCCCAGGGGV